MMEQFTTENFCSTGKKNHNAGTILKQICKSKGKITDWAGILNLNGVFSTVR